MFCKNVYLWTNTKCVWECGNSFYPLLHINISQEQQRDKKNQPEKQWQGETIRAYPGVQTRRWCSSSTANNTFLAPASFQSTVYDLCPHKAILKHIFYSAPNIKENTENMYYIYAKYRHHCLLDLKRRWAANSSMMQCTRFLHRLHGWGGLNGAFYLRCSHSGQQRVNHRCNIIERNFTWRKKKKLPRLNVVLGIQQEMCTVDWKYQFTTFLQFNPRICFEYLDRFKCFIHVTFLEENFGRKTLNVNKIFGDTLLFFISFPSPQKV